MIRVGHFFCGGGGGILASEILGHRSVFATDIDERRCRVVEESGWFPGIYVECIDIREFNPRPWKGRMDCVAAGFPCQDISCAGRGQGIRGERSGFVFEMFKALDVIEPSIVFLENSPRIRTKGRDAIIAELVARGYSWRDGTLAASHVGAGHIRNRWWCLAANSEGKQLLRQEASYFAECGFAKWYQPVSQEPGRKETMENTSRVGSTAYPDESGWVGGPGEIGKKAGWIEFKDSIERAVERGLSETDAEAIAIAGAYTGTWKWSPPDLGLRRVVDGLADRMDRIKTCGDGQVPLQAAVAWALLAWT